MNIAHKSNMMPKTRARLRIFAPAPMPQNNRLYWRVDGHSLQVNIWTHDEWTRLINRPVDAQYLESGVWCALSFD